MKRYSTALILSLALFACGQAPTRTSAEKVASPPDRFSQDTPRNRYPDDVARLLAGLPAQPGSTLAALHERPEWAEHRKQWDAAWSRIDKDTLTPIRQFARQELSSVPESLPVFYPFSGPDALIITTFFPRNRTYIMVGLEPAGTLPRAADLDRDDFAALLSRMRTTVASELSRSFFITRQMDRQFRGQVTDGLTLPILQLLVRNRHTILGVRYVRIGDDGKLVERTIESRDNNKYSNKGVEIDFKSDLDQSTHKLFYFSVNLSDVKLRTNEGFPRFVADLKHVATYFKATSYMVHRKEFSIIRDQVLSVSSAILQDDSGIPYHYLAAPKWKVQLYGQYTRPIGDFRWLQQKDMQAAYQEVGVKPLAFRIGYGFGAKPSNLQLAIRTEPVAEQRAAK